jgi:ATP-dependent RNA helicase RhlE
MSDFKSLSLLSPILKALKQKGYDTPTPIQAQAIPRLMEGRDLLGIAQTGTGKTAAFSLPIIHGFAKAPKGLNKGRARCLILTPTRELASQINDNIKTYSRELDISSTVIFGGVGKQPQIRSLSRGIDFLVATPGRLLDLMNDGYIKYDQLEVFVLDEADRMLDMGFIRDIQKIIKKLPLKKQTLLFSATMPKDIARLATSLLKNPVRVEVTPQATTVEKIKQTINFVDKTNKSLLLKSILEDESIKTILVFTKMKHQADRVVKYLDKVSISAAAIHGNKSQGARERALESFRNGKVRVLVATDIAARGIDVEKISHVINYDLPMEPESYVHRIGRTARAGREGVAISFCDASEMKLLRDIEKIIKSKIPVDIEHAYHGAPPSKVVQADRGPRNNGPNQNRNQKSNGNKSGSPNRNKNKNSKKKINTSRRRTSTRTK